MKKLLATSLAIGLMAVSIGQHATADTVVKVAINGNPVSFSQAPVIHDDFTMVPIREIFERLGAEVQWDQQTRTVTANKGDTAIQLKIGSSYALKNDKHVAVDTPAFILDGRTLVPLRFVSESLGAKVSWEPATKTVSITSLDTKSTSKEFPPLTIEDAVKWAQESNYLLQFEVVSEEMSQKQEEINKDEVAFSVRQAYQDIILKENAVAAREEVLEMAMMQEQLALAKSQIGQISEMEKIKIVKTREDAERNWQKADKALKDAQNKLNFLIRKPKGTVFTLVDKPTYKPKEINLDDHIQKTISNSPSIWLLEEQIELANDDVDSDDEAVSNLAERNVENARMQLAEAKKQLEESIKDMYVQLKELEEEYRLLASDLKMAEDHLGFTLAAFEKGWNTELEVKQAQSSVNEIKRQLDELLIQMDQIQFRLDKPWI